MGAPDISRAGDRVEIEAGKERDIRGRNPLTRTGAHVARTRKRDHGCRL